MYKALYDSTLEAQHNIIIVAVDILEMLFFINRIRLDISFEPSACRRITWNIKHYFLRNSRNISQNVLYATDKITR